MMSANCFSLEQSKICCLGKGYLFTELQNFRLVQIQSICRQQNECNPNIEIGFEKGRKQLWGEKRENAGNQHFPLFPQ